MNTPNSLNSALEREDLFFVIDYIEDYKEHLLHEWKDAQHENFETVLRLAIQEIEQIKNQHSYLNCSIPYQLGKLDGYTDIFERLFRAEESMRAVKQSLVKQTPKTRQILLCLYRNGGMRHGELAAAVGSSYSSLTNMMKKVLLSGAVESTRSGKNTYYYLTEVGRQYCEQQDQRRDELQSLIRMVVEDSIRKVLLYSSVDSTTKKDVSQQLKVSDRFIPIFNNETYDPLSIVSISAIGDIKYVELSGVLTNTEDDGNILRSTSTDKLP